MGSETGQDVERPVHRVFVDAFEIAETQVTVAEYAQFLETTKVAPPPNWNDSNFNRAEQPVTAVSWFDAAAYCEWVSAIAGMDLWLPTEAQWEYAARGGLEGAEYPWGNEPPDSRLGYASRWASGPESVRESPPNGFGLYEMCENVHEWCSDWFDAQYYATSPEQNPRGPEAGTRKSSRGGSWRHHIKVARCAARSSIPPDFKYEDYGFRVVRIS